MCQAFSWKHMPMAGGLFDQNPMLLDRFMTIMSAKQEQERKDELARKRSQGGPTGGKMRGSRPSH